MQGWLEQLLHTHDTPHRTAAAFALGVFLGFSPFLGLHAVLGLILAFVLRLNRVAVLLGVYSNLPWIVPAYYTVTTIAGARILGVDIQAKVLHEAITTVGLISWRDVGELRRVLAPFFWAYTLGSTLGALLLAGVSYQASLVMIRAHRRRLSQKEPKRAEL